MPPGRVCVEVRSLDAQFHTTVLGSSVFSVVGRHRARFAQPFGSDAVDSPCFTSCGLIPHDDSRT
jgi:hypothetical protein